MSVLHHGVVTTLKTLASNQLIVSLTPPHMERRSGVLSDVAVTYYDQARVNKLTLLAASISATDASDSGKLCNLWRLRNLWLTQCTDAHM